MKRVKEKVRIFDSAGVENLAIQIFFQNLSNLSSFFPSDTFFLLGNVSKLFKNVSRFEESYTRRKSENYVPGPLSGNVYWILEDLPDGFALRRAIIYGFNLRNLSTKTKFGEILSSVKSQERWNQVRRTLELKAPWAIR